MAKVDARLVTINNLQVVLTGQRELLHVDLSGCTCRGGLSMRATITKWSLRLSLACLLFFFAARHVDVDLCRDAGGSYSGWLGSCAGPNPPAGLLLEGDGFVGAWVFAVAVALFGLVVIEATARYWVDWLKSFPHPYWREHLVARCGLLAITCVLLSVPTFALTIGFRLYLRDVSETWQVVYYVAFIVNAFFSMVASLGLWLVIAKRYLSPASIRRFFVSPERLGLAEESELMVRGSWAILTRIVGRRPPP